MSNIISRASVRAAAMTLASVLCVLCAASCQKMPVNGDLDGQWRLVELTYDDEDCTPDKAAYWNFNLHVVQWVSNNKLVSSGNMHYDKDKREIAIDIPEYLWVNWRPTLHRIGVGRNPVVYEVVSLDRRHMVLRDGNETAVFDKF